MLRKALNVMVLSMLVGVIFVSGCSAAGNDRKPSIPMSAWVWDWDWASGSVTKDFEGYSRGLFDLCENRNIKTLYLGFEFPIPDGKLGMTEQLLERAHKRGIRVEASATGRGRSDEGVGDYMSGVLAWNRSHPKSQWFDGAHFDNEEYSGTWLDAVRKVWEGDTLAQLKKMDPSFKLGVVAIPALWWGSEERRQEYGYKLQDYTDYVSVMSYFLGDRTLNFFTGPSPATTKPAIDYAAKTGKKIYIGLEVSVWPGEGKSFVSGNYPGWEYSSFASKGEDELLYRIKKINTALGKSPGFGGVVIQSTDAYQALYLTWKEIDRDRRIHGKADKAAEPISGDVSPVEIGGFSARKHNSAEDAAVKTSMAVFDINPSVKPGQVLTFNVVFDEYSDVRPNPLTEEWVPAELIWFGFVTPDAESPYRFLRVDYNGSVGVRVSNDNVAAVMSGVPGDWKDRLRMSYTRFKPEAGKTYEYRLYFFADSRVLLKIIDPDRKKVLWHSDRMPCHREGLSRMYVEVLDKLPWGSIVCDNENRTINVYKGDAVFATISNLRRGSLSDTAK